MKVYPDVDFYALKPEITVQKLAKNAKNNNLLKTKKYWIPKYKQNRGSVFVFDC